MALLLPLHILPEAETTLALIPAWLVGAWTEQIFTNPLITTEVIATRDAFAKRHVRFVLPLAFLSPTILTATVDGTAPASMTVAGLAKALPHRWADQERMHLATAGAASALNHPI